MASRRYRTTRPLYLQVTRALDQLGIAAMGSPTTAILIALSVTGLILLDARPTQTRVTRQQVAELAERLRLGWRPRLGLRAAAVMVYAP